MHLSHHDTEDRDNNLSALYVHSSWMAYSVVIAADFDFDVIEDDNYDSSFVK